MIKSYLTKTKRYVASPWRSTQDILQMLANINVLYIAIRNMDRYTLWITINKVLLTHRDLVMPNGDIEPGVHRLR